MILPATFWRDLAANALRASASGADLRRAQLAGVANRSERDDEDSPEAPAQHASSSRQTVFPFISFRTELQPRAGSRFRVRDEA